MDMPNTYSQRVAERVRLAIRSSGRSVASIADETQIPRVTLIRRLAGAGKPFDVAEIHLISAALGIDSAELLRDAVAA